jgi:hypothetical protein
MKQSQIILDFLISIAFIFKIKIFFFNQNFEKSSKNIPIQTKVWLVFNTVIQFHVKYSIIKFHNFLYDFFLILIKLIGQ